MIGSSGLTRIVSGLVFFLLLSALFLALTACNREGARKLQIGDQAPPFSLQDFDGNIVTLSGMQGNPVVLRFFLTDCDYCRADTPVFNDFYRRYHSQGLQVVYIDSLGINEKEVHAFVRDLAIPFSVVQDKDKVVSSAYQVRALPETVVLAPDHKIIAAILGGVSEAELTELLSPYLTDGKS